MGAELSPVDFVCSTLPFAFAPRDIGNTSCRLAQDQEAVEEAPLFDFACRGTRDKDSFDSSSRYFPLVSDGSRVACPSSSAVAIAVPASSLPFARAPLAPALADSVVVAVVAGRSLAVADTDTLEVCNHRNHRNSAAAVEVEARVGSVPSFPSPRLRFANSPSTASAVCSKVSFPVSA